MSMNAQTLSTARETLISIGHEKLVLVGQVNEQKRKIADLEREVQRQAHARQIAERLVADLRAENDALRAQIPDEPTIQAYNDLVQFITAPSSTHPELRIAA
jgi:hypothetical protein